MPKFDIAHIILTVKDFEKSKKFYQEVFIDTLGCKLKLEESDFFYIQLNNDTDLSLGIVPEHKEFKVEIFNRYKVGLHHFAIELESREQVNKAFEKVKQLGCVILDKPQIFPDYGDSYYAFYFLDLDGLKQEFVTFKN